MASPTPMKAVVDCVTGATTMVPLTADEIAAKQAAVTAAAATTASQTTLATNRQTAIATLKTKAIGGDVTSTLTLQAMGIDPNS